MNYSANSSSLLRRLFVLFLILATPLFGGNVKVFTSFGKTRVTPEGVRSVVNGTNVVFTAPVFVYLSDQFEELAETPQNIGKALYRARCAGYTMSDGQNRILGIGDANQGKLEIIKKIEGDLSVTWQWEVQYAFSIESETSTILAGSGNEGLGKPDPAVGKFWVSRGTALTPSVDGVINAEANGIRFRIEGAEVDGLTRFAAGETSGFPGNGTDKYFSWPKLSSEHLSFGGPSHNLKVAKLPLPGTTLPSPLPYPGVLPAANDFQFTSTPRYVPGASHQFHVVDFWFNNLGENEWQTSPDVPYTKDQYESEFATVFNLYDSQRAGGGGGLVGVSFSESYQGDFVFRRNDYNFTSADDFDKVFSTIPREIVSVGWHHVCVISEYVPGDSKLKVSMLLDGRELSRNIIEGINVDQRPFHKPFDSVRVGSVQASSDDTTDPEFHQAGLTEVNDIRVWHVPSTSSAVITQLNSSKDAREKMARDLGAQSSAQSKSLPLGTNLQPVFEESFDAQSSSRIEAKFEQELRLELPSSKAFPFANVSERAVLPQLLVTGPMTVKWTWDKEVRYRIGALDADGSPMSDDVFMNTYPQGTTVAQILAGASPTKSNLGIGDYWLNEKEVVWAGARYRTLDRRNTLADFIATPSGDFQNFGREISKTYDTTTADGKVARAHFIGDAQLPSDLNWAYDRTRFRAFVPLGEGLDARWLFEGSTTIPLNPLPANVQLVPDLPDGARLKVDRGGPTLVQVLDNSTPGTSLAGAPFQWDFVGQRLLPVQPYRFVVDWPAAGDNENFLIEVASGWPGDALTLAGSFTEDENGKRIVATEAPVAATRTRPTAETFTDDSVRGSLSGALAAKIRVAYLTGALSSITLEVDGVTHEEISDLHILLIPPGGTNAEGYYLFGNQLSGPVTNQKLTFSGTDSTNRVAAPLAFVGATTTRTLQSLVGTESSNLNGEWTVKIADDTGQKIGSVGQMTLSVLAGSRASGSVYNATRDKLLSEGFQTFQVKNDLGSAPADTILSVEVELVDLLLTESGGRYEISLESPDGKIINLARGQAGAVANPSPLTVKFAQSGASDFDLTSLTNGAVYRPSDGGITAGQLILNTDLTAMNSGPAAGSWRLHVAEPAVGSGAIASLGQVRLTVRSRKSSSDPTASENILRMLPIHSVTPLAPYAFDGMGYDRVDVHVDGLGPVKDFNLILNQLLVKPNGGDYEIVMESPGGIFTYLAKGAIGPTTSRTSSVRFSNSAPVRDPWTPSADGVYGNGSSYYPPALQAGVPLDPSYGVSLVPIVGGESEGTWRFHFLVGANSAIEGIVEVQPTIIQADETGKVFQTYPSNGRQAIPNSAQILEFDYSGFSGVVDEIELSFLGNNSDFSFKDAELALQSPDGTIIPLMANAGGDALWGKFDSLKFSTSATESIGATTAPVSGTFYRPSVYGVSRISGATAGSGLATLSGTNAQGIWKVISASTESSRGTRMSGTLTIKARAGAQNFIASGGMVPDDSGEKAMRYEPNNYTLFVSGFEPGQVIKDLDVVLNGLRHERPSDLHIGLRSPSGKCVYLVGNAFGATALPSSGLTLDDERSSYLGLTGLRSNPELGKPTLNGTAILKDVNQNGAIDSNELFNTQLSAFDGESPNGTWTLIVGDVKAGSTGGLDSGFTLNFTTARPQKNAVTGEPVYLQTVALPMTGSQFPGSPSSHYSYLYSSDSAKTSPLELDNNPSDRWAYDSMTFSEIESLQVERVSPFTMRANRAGRSVALYSYRPDSSEIASGDVDREAFVVRVLAGKSLDDALAVPAANRRVPQVGNGTGNYLPLAAVTNGSIALNAERLLAIEDGSFAADFWLDVTASGASNASLLSLPQPGYDLSLVAGQINGRQSFQLTVPVATGTRAILIPNVKTQGWHHYWLNILPVSGGVGYEFYQDGLLIAQSEAIVTRKVASGNMSLFQGFGEWNAGVDNFRLWGNAATASEVGDRLKGFSIADTGIIALNDFDANFSRAPLTVTVDPAKAASTKSPFTLQEIANPLASPFDLAGFNSGWVANAISNYNASIYQRDSAVGSWGRIFPVNDQVLYQAPNRQLEVVYYRNPSLDQLQKVTTSATGVDTVTNIFHPNVAWPTDLQNHNQVSYPTNSDDAAQRIYIASRVGTEGVNANGLQQPVFTADKVDELTIYNQASRALPGYNPNEEHALVAPSIRAQLTGEGAANITPNAAFALQNALNRTDASALTGANIYTSQPWVLVEFDNVTTGLRDMAAYQVEETRTGANVFPVVDAVTHQPVNPYTSTAGVVTEGASYDFGYAFNYEIAAGDLLIPPYPLNLVIGSVKTPGATGENIAIDEAGTFQRALWWDYKGNAYAVSGGGKFIYQYVYPYRADFDGAGRDLAVGDQLAWLPRNKEQEKVILGLDGKVDLDSNPVTPVQVTYNSYWGIDYPKLKKGESLAYQGGEYKADHPAAEGLPAVVGMAAAEIIFDSETPKMTIAAANLNKFSARIVRPLDQVSVALLPSAMPGELQPAATTNVMVDGARWYFRQLAGSLSGRVYYDVLEQKLVLRGKLNGMESGDANLTSGIEALNVLEPAFLTQSEFESLSNKAAGNGVTLSQDWKDAVKELYRLSQNPKGLRGSNTELLGSLSGPPKYLHGLQNSSDYLSTLESVASQVQEISGRSPVSEIKLKSDYDKAVTALNKLITDKKTDLPSDAKGKKAAELEIKTLERDLKKLKANWKFVLKVAGADTTTVPGNLKFYAPDQTNPSLYRPLNSFGAGSVLVPNQGALMKDSADRRFITLAENNDPQLAGAAVTLHVIELARDRYRGGLKVIEPSDAFSERIEVKHNADFGGSTKNLYYEWYIRESAPLDVVAGEVPTIGTANQDPDWKLYSNGLDLNSIQFEGRPDIALADQLFLLRYRHKNETEGWKLVTLDAPTAADWVSGSGNAADPIPVPLLTPVRAPFQWSGAANSPQLQADGSKRYIPALVMGWVKRVLDRINPYEARYTDLLNNESPAVYSSMLQIFGKPFIGPVALNSNKDVIEGVGLIELYETVLKRARDLTIDNSQPGAATDGTNQAVLLATTRLAVFYELLGGEAYSDFRDPTIRLDDSGTFDSVLTSVHAFQNQQNGILDESLALLRGTDFVTSYPSYNRLFWNYVKGLGEAAYNVNYNITDTNLDGFINEVDARTLYPQGHGDAWGHYLSAANMHYTLLRHNAYTWRSRAELYSLLDNVIEADYLDEKTFAKNAAAKARAGRDIVQESYRDAYSADPDGQWQGYDDPNKARAWGVGDWARRAGQGAYFDFLTGNAILPESASATLQDDFNDGTLTAEGVAVIERREASQGLGEVAANLAAIQNTLDQAALGVNPLGLRNNSISFDIDPTLLAGSDEGIQSHFEQVYAKAVTSLQNAERSTRISSESANKLRRISNDTARLTAEVYDNDLAFRTALVGVFGRPHAGNVGFGKPFPEGYDGPDTTFYNYLAKNGENQTETPWGGDSLFLTKIREKFEFGNQASIFDNDDDQDVLRNLYDDVFRDDTSFGNVGWKIRFNESVKTFLFQDPTELDTDPVVEWHTEAKILNDIALQANSDWGQRPAYGELQILLEEMLVKEIEFANIVDEYQGYMGDYVTTIRQAEIAIELADRTLQNTQEWQIANRIHVSIQAAAGVVESIQEVLADAAKETALGVSEAFPIAVGFSNDITSVARAASIAAGVGISTSFDTAAQVAGYVGTASELIQTFQEIEYDIDAEEIDVLAGVIDAFAEIEYAAGDEGAIRFTIRQRQQELEVIRQQYITKLNEGFALLKEREAFNTGVAGDSQRNRYLDMMLRLTRNEAQAKHSLVLENARRYTWLAAKAYEYEVNPVEGSAASATGLLEEIVKAGAVGTMVDGVPTIGGGGLSEVLALLKANHSALKGQLGINNPQEGRELISLRKELFRIGNVQAASEVRWKETLKNHKVADLWDVPAFASYCRPFAARGDEPQPGLVIPFSTTIESGKNFFGHSLLPGDHSFSSSNYSTKIASLGVWFKDYSSANLASAPRIYLVPVGQDYMRTSNAGEPVVRAWNLIEQVIPTPFALNSNDLSQPGFIPSFDGVDGVRGDVRRFGDFRAFATDTGQPDSSGMIRDSRLIGRSVWNSQWLMIIPGATLGTNEEGSLDTFAEDVSDIMLNFETYTHRGL